MCNKRGNEEMLALRWVARAIGTFEGAAIVIAIIVYELKGDPYGGGIRSLELMNALVLGLIIIFVSGVIIAWWKEGTAEYLF